MRTVRVLASDPDLLAAVEDSARRRDALEELRTRPTEQRELLHLASERHQRQLSRLRDRSDRLRATTQLSALARLARGIDEYDGWPGDADGVAEPARNEERTG